MAGVIAAAGVVLVRRAKSGIEICLIHRPRQGDWSLPKGKADNGELPPSTARREAVEETGLDVVLGASLGRQRYKVDGQAKAVDYWRAHIRPGGPGFSPNKEVDRIQWMSVQKAKSRLTYSRDRHMVLEGLATSPTSPIVVLRHTEAMKRSDFNGKSDPRRPLTSTGRKQARAIVDPISAFGQFRIFTSDSKRCVQTVTPLASALGRNIHEEPLFSEERFAKRPKAAVNRLLELAEKTTPVVVCTHRPVLPSVLSAVVGEFGVKARSPAVRPDLDPGGFVIFHRELDPRGRLTGRVVSVERYDNF